MDKNLLKIIKNYGVNHQLKYFQSEVFELNEAVIKHENKNPITLAFDILNQKVCEMTDKKYEVSSIKDIAQEIADCYVMLEQFRLYYGIELEDVRKIMNYKIDRQLKRIEEDD